MIDRLPQPLVMVDFHCREFFLIFTRVSQVEAMYKWPSLKVKVERGSTLTCTRGLFTHVKITRQRKFPPSSLISTDALLTTHVNARKF